MRIENRPVSFEDSRGIIRDVISDEKISSISVITCTKGGIRGNHYHKKSAHYTFVVSGRLLCRAQKPGESIEEAEIGPGDLMIEDFLESHAIVALEDSVILHLYVGTEGLSYKDDTFPSDSLLIS